MKLVIAGASGYIGRALVHLSVECGHQVLMLVRRRCEELRPYGEQACISDARGLTGSTADALINVAGAAHIAKSTADFDFANRQLPLQLAASILDGKIGRLIHLSSLSVFGSWSVRPINEMSAPSPTTPYAQSKLEADQQLTALFGPNGKRLTIIRAPMVYGAACPGNFLRLCRLVSSGAPLPFGAAHARRSFIFVKNLADFLLRCAEPNRPGGVFVVGDGSDYSVIELIEWINSACGKGTKNIAVPIYFLRIFSVIPGLSRTLDSLTRPMLVDWQRARTLMDWKPPVSRSDAMTATLSRLIAHPGPPL